MPYFKYDLIPGLNLKWNHMRMKQKNLLSIQNVLNAKTATSRRPRQMSGTAKNILIKNKGGLTSRLISLVNTLTIIKPYKLNYRICK